MAKPRILILTDITSIRAGYKEPDDCQSLIRLLVMSNAYDIEGLIAGSRLHHGQDVCPDHLHTVVDAYAKVHSNLTLHARGFPAPDNLHSLIKPGQPMALPELPVEASIGENEDTPASDHIIKVLQKKDPRPLWILVWGGTADLAQALWRIRASCPASVGRTLRRRLRVYAIADQDSTGPWIRQQFPDIWYLLSNRCHRGMYRFGDTTLCSPLWVTQNLTDNHGPLGAAYPMYDGGDVFSGVLGKVRGVKEGDTPSFLYLFDNGLNCPDSPPLGGWGGRFLRSPANPRHFLDASDPITPSGDDILSKAATVYRWRQAYQNEFAARMDWCVKPPAQGSHPPIVSLTGPTRHHLHPGKCILLDLSASRSSGGGGVTVHWYPYPLDPDTQVEFENPDAARTRVSIKSSHSGILYLLGDVTGAGDPPLTRYARVAVQL